MGWPGARIHQPRHSSRILLMPPPTVKLLKSVSFIQRLVQLLLLLLLFGPGASAMPLAILQFLCCAIFSRLHVIMGSRSPSCRPHATLLGTHPCWLPHALLLEELMAHLIILLLRCALSNMWWQRGLSRPWLLWGAIVACRMTIAGLQLLGHYMREMWRWREWTNISGMAIEGQIMW